MLMFQESLAETTREVLPPCRCVAVSSGGNNNRNHGAERRTQALHPGRVTKRKVARRGDKVGEVGEGGRRGIGPGNPDWSVTAPFPSLPQREQPGIGTRSDARAQTDSCRRGKTEAEMVRCPGVVWDGWLWLLLTGGHRDGTPGQLGQYVHIAMSCINNNKYQSRTRPPVLLLSVSPLPAAPLLCIDVEDSGFPLKVRC